MFAPTDYSGEFAVPQNRFALCGFYIVLWDEGRRCRFMLRCWFYLMFGFYVLFGFVLHRLCRLTPIEALPQAPLGALPLVPPQWVSPLDPDQGRAPGPFARFARCWGTTLVSFAHSSLLTPHSSLLIPHSSLFTPVFKLDKCLKKCYYTIVIKLICKFSVLSERK